MPFDTVVISVLAGQKKGFLFKKKKVDNVYQSRFFILDATTLTYYKKITVSAWQVISQPPVCVVVK